MATTSNGNYIESNPLRPVNEAVQEYRVREDGALAHHLQEREIEHHLALNVEQRRTVMEDIKAAKMLQDEEDKRAQIFTIDEQEELKTRDERLAEEMQAALLQKEVELKELEDHDNEIAQKMIERDKKHDERQLSHDRRMAEKIERMKLREERKKELSDEDLAWKLQEEERRRLKYRMQSREHINTVIEMQDEELARFIHEKEEAEMMKRKEYEDRRRRKGSHKHSEDHHTHSDDPDAPEHPHSSHHQHVAAVARKSRSSKKLSKSHDALNELPRRDTHDELPSRPGQQSRKEEPQYARVRKHKENPPSHGERHSRRHNERPQRPPPPNGSERATTDPRSRSKSRENLLEMSNGEIPSSSRRSKPKQRVESRERKRSDERSDNPWKRFPQSSSQPPKRSSIEEDIPYGEGFARLADQEFGNRNPREDRKKKNKNDCKQQ